MVIVNKEHPDSASLISLISDYTSAADLLLEKTAFDRPIRVYGLTGM